jgi:hypothetical protein
MQAGHLEGNPMITILISLALLALTVLVTAWLRDRKRMWQDNIRERAYKENDNG